jgi:hypothetical protein
MKKKYILQIKNYEERVHCSTAYKAEFNGTNSAAAFVRRNGATRLYGCTGLHLPTHRNRTNQSVFFLLIPALPHRGVQIPKP